MRQKTLKNRTGWMIFTATISFCLALGAIPSQAADKVVVIPLVRVIESESGPLASVIKTGQTTSYATGDDGTWQKGASVSGRFVDNGNGTVTDRLTGLIWLKEAQCTTFFSGDVTGTNNRSWAPAIAAANQLASPYCGLSDGSKAGDWRLPNRKELISLIDDARFQPALPIDCPLVLPNAYYWSSTTVNRQPTVAYVVNLDVGYMDSGEDKLNVVNTIRVWAVRGGL